MSGSHIAWPSIGQFREVIRNVERSSQFKGFNEANEPIIDSLAPKPTMKFEGTVKLHGTCAGVVVTYTNKMWCQSRSNIITVEKDNAGFAMFCKKNKDILLNLVNSTGLLNPLTKVIIFGEWCGGKIQKGVALNQLPNMFVIFSIATADNTGKREYLSRQAIENIVKSFGVDNLNSNSIYHIYQFPTWEISIDFENPHNVVQALNDITNMVESECPVGKYFGVSGIGEGVVWTPVDRSGTDSGYWFKVKGEKHCNSKVKTLASVDVEKINNIKALAERVAHNGRLEQISQQVFNTLNGGEVDIRLMGDFIKGVMTDIYKEDIDIIAASGYNFRELTGPISKIAKNFVLKQLDK